MLRSAAHLGLLLDPASGEGGQAALKRSVTATQLSLDFVILEELEYS